MSVHENAPGSEAAKPEGSAPDSDAKPNGTDQTQTPMASQRSARFPADRIGFAGDCEQSGSSGDEPRSE